MTPSEIWLSYNAAENRHEFAVMGEYVAPDLTVVVNGRQAMSSAEEDERANRLLVQAYPDYRRVVDQVVDDGEWGVVRWRMTGTSARDGLPDLDVAGCSVVAARDGRMTQAFLYYDGAALDALLASD